MAYLIRFKEWFALSAIVFRCTNLVREAFCEQVWTTLLHQALNWSCSWKILSFMHLNYQYFINYILYQIFLVAYSQWYCSKISHPFNSNMKQATMCFSFQKALLKSLKIYPWNSICLWNRATNQVMSERKQLKPASSFLLPKEQQLRNEKKSFSLVT